MKNFISLFEYSGKSLNIHLTKLFFAGLISCIMISCQNDMAKIKTITNFVITPVQSAKDITVLRSDSGKLQLYLVSPQLDLYQGEQSYYKYPKGLKVIFYDINKREKAKLTADYAIHYEERGIMEIKNNVVIVDLKKGDTIYTSSLTWDQNRKTITSNVAVKRVNKEGVLYGDGFDADESFSDYTLRNPHGTINIDKSE
ncbi:MAG: LPS export ABC transporter periplasmic protein LptC [Bacteroidetes bacterium]|nr:LPS export ABC transporter periplasmic protein LptC [Bacteroidota bacterium]